MKEARNESEVFYDLVRLCRLPGYVHAIAYFCMRDNIFYYEDELTGEDISKLRSDEKLIRTEISTLIGLMLKGDKDFSITLPDILEQYVSDTESLLKELHDSMNKPFYESLKDIIEKEKDENPFEKGSLLKETIFYGGESAYDFQYLDLSIKKYQKDEQWFIENKGFEISDVEVIVNAITDLHYEKISDFKQVLLSTHPSEWTPIGMFTFNVDEIVLQSGKNKKVIESFINAFLVPEDSNNATFEVLNDFNESNAYPFIRFSESEYLLLQHYNLLEALYETPFFWFLKDKGYSDIAMENRGSFTEEFSKEKLESIFGKERVFINVEIYDVHKKKRLGEIDVLVLFADRAIVLQAKSKKLTLESRKGNDKAINKDFNNAIQDSYDQGYECSVLLQNDEVRLFDSKDVELKINRNLKEIYIFCVVSDHYPSLSFQVEQFLKYHETDAIRAPIVMDVFFLDVMAEMLSSPLYFLSYVNRRSALFKKVHTPNELTLLSFHLQTNLFLADEYTMMTLDEGISSELDQAMLSRRMGIPGKKTPIGILTKFKETKFERILADISNLEHSYAIELGFFLLQFSEDTVDLLNEGIDKCISEYTKDGKNHNYTLGFGELSTGLTIHCNNLPYHDAYKILINHCERRKYIQRSDNWFGLCIDPITTQLRFGIMSNEEWKYSEAIESKVQLKVATSEKKIPRNSPCPCGSGKKYKKCCYKLKF